MELHKWFHKFFRLVEIVNKASLQDSIFKFNSIFLALFIKFIFRLTTRAFSKRYDEMFDNLYEKSSHPKRFLQPVSLKLLEIPWMYCCVVSSILEKAYWKSSVLVTLLVCCCEAIHRSFLMKMIMKIEITFLNKIAYLPWNFENKRLIWRISMGGSFIIFLLDSLEGLDISSFNTISVQF